MAALFSNNLRNYNPANFGNGAGFMQHLNQMNPQMNYTVDGFNRANAANPALAFLMASQGGQQFRNAIMQQNGWDQNKMNQWLNNAGYNQGGLAGRGMTPQNIAALQGFGATMAPQTYSQYGNATNNQTVPNTNGGALANGTMPAGYTGYGNSVLTGSNTTQPTATNNQTPTRPPVIQNYTPTNNGPVAPPSGGALSAVQQLLNSGNTLQTHTPTAPSPITGINPFTGKPFTSTVPTRPTPTTNPAGYRVNNQNTLYYKQY